MSDADINNLSRKDDILSDAIAEITKAKKMAIAEILKEKRMAIADIRAEEDLAIEELHIEADDTTDSQAASDMAEAVKKQRKKGLREGDRRTRDAHYKVHEKKHHDI
ncbi:hypothetical protein SAMN05216262_1112 [Colwellia chukchiensis]|uniref:Uncharacterized protein n=1 Tax=Colwellia chukchiensis TaxID=641665 RepID=A0A1H7Q7J5_9GAMM|nr:hypothetical protein [Colwellia chukchiensis]SEL43769.1 hypothetical protein SAMN05216262_1112 [Colwellia chukchiensis]